MKKVLIGCGIVFVMFIVGSSVIGANQMTDAGNILISTQPAIYFSSFSLCNWPTKVSPQYAIQEDNKEIYVIGSDGKTIAKLSAPKCPKMAVVRGIPVIYNNKNYFAVLSNYESWNVSILYLYDSKQKLVYAENLPGLFTSLEVIPSEKSGSEILLVGGDNIILKYTF
jgi:hypothetical protein